MTRLVLLVAFLAAICAGDRRRAPLSQGPGPGPAIATGNRTFAPVAVAEPWASLESPCPLVFRYNSAPTPDHKYWQGSLVVSVNSPVHGLWLRITFTDKANVLVSDVGEVWTKDNKEFAIVDLKRDLKPEQNLIISIRVTFGDMDTATAPRLHTLALNGKQICPALQSGRATGNGNNNEVHDPKPQDLPTQQTVATAEKYRSSDCGQIKIRSPKGLILNSAVARYGYYPWHAALNQYDPVDRTFKYICGGTLISPSLILTAGHCVAVGKRAVKPSTLLIHLGKYTAHDTSEDGVQDKRVSAIHLHRLFEYSSGKIRHDIAIMKLATPALINDLVRPVCLWEEDKIDLSNVVNRQGTVAGWGYEVNQKLTEELRETRMPVVGQDTCYFSDQTFYNAVISNFTYCAGRSGTGGIVCNGDSGGGMVFKKNEDLADDESTWLLRGVVSLSAADSNNHCDPTHYVVFSDVAKYLDWITSFLEDEG